MEKTSRKGLRSCEFLQRIDAFLRSKGLIWWQSKLRPETMTPVNAATNTVLEELCAAGEPAQNTVPPVTATGTDNISIGGGDGGGAG